MRWLRAGLQIGQAVKNVQRLRQIIAVFARKGFVDIVERMNLGRFLPPKLASFAEAESGKSAPERLREAFEELGPTFVKFGQLLSTRSDLVPEAYLEELTRLQDNVQSLPFEVVKSQVEAELGRSLTEAFAWFDENPLASASIGQVHRARLHSGEKVVVKIQRPEIERLITQDISLLAFLAGLLEKTVPESRVFNPKTVVDEFFRTLSFELDYVIEANNMTRMAENLAAVPEVTIPRVHKAHSTSKVLTQDELEGIRVNDPKALDAAGIDRKRVVHAGARAFFKSILIDGLFHGDLHGGNLFVLPGNRIGIIDFGIVGRLSEKSRDRLANMVMALLTEDYENLCYQYAELGASGPSVDFDAFQREVRNALSPYLGLPLSELNSGKVLIEATKIAARHSIQVPGDWMLVFKAILTVEGMGRSLDPTFDVLAAGQEFVRELVKNQYAPQKIAKDLLWVAKDVAALMQVLPRQIRWMFRKFNSNDFAFEVKLAGFEDLRAQLDRGSRRTSTSILSAGALVAAALTLQAPSERQILGHPAISVALFLFGALLAARLILGRR